MKISFECILFLLFLILLSCNDRYGENIKHPLPQLKIIEDPAEAGAFYQVRLNLDTIAQSTLYLTLSARSLSNRDTVGFDLRIPKNTMGDRAYGFKIMSVGAPTNKFFNFLSDAPKTSLHPFDAITLPYSKTVQNKTTASYHLYFNDDFEVPEVSIKIDNKSKSLIFYGKYGYETNLFMKKLFP